MQCDCSWIFRNPFEGPTALEILRSELFLNGCEDGRQRADGEERQNLLAPAFSCFPASSSVNGQVLYVDGGISISL